MKGRSETMDDLITRWQRYTAPMHAHYVAPQKKTADFVVSGGKSDVSLIEEEIRELLKVKET